MRSVNVRGRTSRCATVAVAALAAAGGLVAVAVPAIAGTAPVKNVKVADDYFVRSDNSATIAVKRGTIVRFNFVGSSKDGHDVTVARGPVTFRSGRRTRGTYPKLVTRVGSYIIVCTVHPGMEMKLNVRR